MSETQLQAPANVVAIAEGAGNRIFTHGDDTNNTTQYENLSGPNGSGSMAEIVRNDTAAYAVGRTRHNYVPNYAFADGHAKSVHAPNPSYSNLQLDSSDAPTVTAVTSTSGVIFERSINPNATGWFLED